MKKITALLLCLLLLLGVVLTSCEAEESSPSEEEISSRVEENEKESDENEAENELPAEPTDPKLEAYSEALQHLNAGEIEKAYDLFLTIKDYRDVSTFLERFSFGYQTSFFYEDDYGFVFHYEYDEYGRPILQRYFSTMSEHMTVIRQEYDEKGNLIKHSYQYSPQNIQETTYEYDEEGKLIRQNDPYMDGDGTYKLAAYDEKGNVVRIGYYFSYENEPHFEEFYEYNEEGKRTKLTQKSNMYEYIETYEYDVCGNMVKESQTYNGVLRYFTAYEYDERGNKIKGSHYSNEDSFAEPHTVWSWEYDENGKLTAQTYESDSYSSKTEYEYDSDGNCIKETYFRDGQAQTVNRMEYDCYGNLLKRETEERHHSVTAYSGYKLYYNPYGYKTLPTEFEAKG
ncbi:MAG: RHS repeat protein [Clostridia bacterium]|nr:RHS repeat protein [Clostridia bacterium]